MTSRALLLVVAVLLIGPVLHVFGQGNADSLRTVAEHARDPQARFLALRQLSRTNDPILQAKYAAAAIRIGDSLLLHASGNDSLVRANLAPSYWNMGRSLSLRSNASDSILRYYTHALEIWRGSKNRERVAFAQLHIGNLLLDRGQIGAAMDRYREAEDYYAQQRDSAQLAAIHGGMGHAYMDMGRYLKAIQHYSRSLELVPTDEPLTRGITWNNLGLIYLYEGQQDTAMACFKRSAEADLSGGDTLSALTPWNNMAKILSDQKRFDEAIGMLNKALRHVDEEAMPEQSAMLYNSLANVYTAMEDLPTAEDRSKKAVSLAEEGHRPEILISARTTYTSVLMMQKRWHEAMRVAEVNDGFCSARVVPLTARLDIAGQLAQLHKELGHTAEAYTYLQAQMALKDSMSSDSVRNALQALDFRKQELEDSTKAAEARDVLQTAHDSAMRSERDRKLYFMYGGIAVVVVAGVLWWLLRRTRRQKKRSEEILYNVLPEEVAREIRETGTTRSKEIEQVTILFTDFKGFTEMSARITQQELMTEINTCFQAFDAISSRHHVEKIKTIGDAYMAAAGLNGDAQGSAVRTVHAALEMQAFIEARYTERSAQGHPAFRMRVGIHTGPVVAGIVGVKKFQYDIWGDTVNTASRMESSGEVGKVNISEATYALMRSEPGFTFSSRGKVQAKGKGEMEMYFVERRA